MNIQTIIAKSRDKSAQPAQRAAAKPKADEFDDAVREAKEILARIEAEHRQGQMRLGELADQVRTTYGDRSIAKFAKAIGIASCTLARYRSVYRAWDGSGIQAPGPVSYAVPRELQNNPDRAAIVEKNPKLTKREARELEQECKGQTKKQKHKVVDESKKHYEAWQREVQNLADDSIRLAAIADQKLKPESECILRGVVEPDLITHLRGSSKAQAKLAAFLERLLAEDDKKEEAPGSERRAA
jgi:hypothetical protein